MEMLLNLRDGHDRTVAAEISENNNERVFLLPFLDFFRLRRLNKLCFFLNSLIWQSDPVEIKLTLEIILISLIWQSDPIVYK